MNGIAVLHSRRASLVAAVCLAMSCVGVAAATTPAGGSAAVAALAPKAKATSKPAAAGAKTRVSPYAKFRRDREEADRAKGIDRRPGSDHPAGQAPSRRMPK